MAALNVPKAKVTALRKVVARKPRKRAQATNTYKGSANAPSLKKQGLA